MTYCSTLFAVIEAGHKPILVDISKNKSTEIPVTMNYPKKNYSKIKPVIDWIPIILGWIEARLDGKRI